MILRTCAEFLKLYIKDQEIYKAAKINKILGERHSYWYVICFIDNLIF